MNVRPAVICSHHASGNCNAAMVGRILLAVILSLATLPAIALDLTDDMTCLALNDYHELRSGGMDAATSIDDGSSYSNPHKTPHEAVKGCVKNLYAMLSASVIVKREV